MLQVLLALVVTVFITPAFGQNFTTYRLPNNTRPETYDLSIRTWIHEGNPTFFGSVRIGIVAIESTDYIRIHHNVAQIDSVRVVTAAGEVPVPIGTYSYNRTYTFLTIPMTGGNLTEGTRYFIDIDYVGTMNDYSGFYRSSYSVNNARVWFASTQFEATFARSAFPCYDEPSLKSSYTIRITHDSSYSAISNMPALSETMNPDGSVTTHFETTPLMSTYLVAFHVSDFLNVTSTPPRSVPQRIFSRSTAINATVLPLEAGELLIDALTDYIGIEYSLPKMDHVAVPSFPVDGAKGNWGLIASYEFSTLFNEAADYYTRSVGSLRTLSHSISHSWFGNLVTPRWYTYLWMKEGFATFFEYLGADLVHPDWQMMDYFVVEVAQLMFFADATTNSRPMTYYVERPYDIDEHFNRVAYSKGAAVLRMFWFMFGEETFMRAVRSYLEDNAYSNAAEEELFDALDDAVRSEIESIIPDTVDVRTIMISWTRQAGIPVITVNRNYDDRTNQVTLRQARYYGTQPANPANTTWWIPYNLATPNNPGFENTRVEGWIPQYSSSWEITVDSLSADDYLLVSKRAAGYYRIMYDERNYKLLSDAILRNASEFHTTNVAQLMDDAFEFYRSNRLTLASVLDLLRVLEFDSNFVSWSPALYTIYFVNLNFKGHQNYPIWTDFVRSLTEKIYDSVGVEDIPGEPILRKYARTSIVELACRMGSVHCRSDANRQLRRLIESGDDFHQNVRPVLKCASLRSATRADYFFVWNGLRLLDLGEYSPRLEIIDWLGCTTSRHLLTEYIRSSIDSTNSHNFEYSRYEQYAVIDSILDNAGNLGIDVALTFLIENAVETSRRFGSYFVQKFSRLISNAEHIERVSFPTGSLSSLFSIMEDELTGKSDVIFQYVLYQNTLRDAGYITQDEIDYNMNLVANSVRWLETDGVLVNNWLMENFV